MRTPEEIKKRLECCNTYNDCLNCPYDKVDGSWACTVERNADAIAYIKQLEDDRKERDILADAYQELESNQPKWISVEERLPDDDVNVLVYAIGNHESSIIAMTSYTHRMHGYNIEGCRSPWQYFFHEYKITYWMPLPDAPKEDE